MLSLSLLAAWLYALLCGVLVAFQLALAGGAPWGHLTQGGRHPGVLDGKGRAMALGSAVLLAVMALAVLSAAGLSLTWPRWTFWAALAVTALTTLANAATPSAPERRLWLPVALAMLASALVVAFTATS